MCRGINIFTSTSLLMSENTNLNLCKFQYYEDMTCKVQDTLYKQHDARFATARAVVSMTVRWEEKKNVHIPAGELR